MSRVLQSRDSDQTQRPTVKSAGVTDAVRKFLDLAQDRFDLCRDAESANRTEMMKAQRFRDTDMWPPQIKEQRLKDNLPCLTIDKISGPIDQLTGDERQSRPGIAVSAGPGGDRETADFFADMARAILAESHAEIAIDWAFEQAASIGLGWMQLSSEYESDDTFDQILRVSWVENTFAVYTDPTVQMWDRRDMRFAFVAQWVPTDTFTEKYGTAALASVMVMASIGDGNPEWFATDKGVRVMTYWFVVVEMVERVRLASGEVLDADRVHPDVLKALSPDDRREVPKRTVKRAVISGADILEGNQGTDTSKNTDGQEWGGKYVPLVPVIGKFLNVDGKRKTYGLIRNAMEPQMQANVMESAATQACSTASRSPWLAVKGQIEKYKSQWDTANQRDWSVLVYDNVDVNGHLSPPPQRQTVEPPIKAFLEMAMRADQNVRAATAFYDASDPNRKNSEQSGKAIAERQRQGAIGNIGYIDNLKRSMAYLGEMLVDAIPVYYGDRPGRYVQIVGLNQQSSLVQIGPVAPQPKPGLMARGVDAVKGMFGGGQPAPPAQPTGPTPKVITLKPGRYAIAVSAGANYQTKRQETVANLIDLFKVYPPLAQAGMHILLDNMDGPGMKEMADQAKKIMPPALQDAPDGQEQDPAAMQAAMAQHQQMIDQLTAALNAATEIIKSKTIEAHTKKEVALMMTNAQITVAAMRFGNERDRAALDAASEKFTQEIDHIHDLVIQESDQDHEKEMAALGAAQDQTMASGQQAHEAAMGAMGHVNDMAQGDQAHAQTMAEGDQTHAQNLEKGDVAHVQTMEQQAAAAKAAAAAAATKPKAGGGTA